MVESETYGTILVMKLFSWNVNGIRAVLKKGEFQKFIAKYDPDILCIQETKASEGQAELDLPQYKEYWSSAEKKGYSGTAIFSKAEALNVITGLPEDLIDKHGIKDDGYGNPATEGRIIAAEFEGFYVVTCYTPNSKGDLSRLQLRYKHWDPAVLDYLKRLEQTKPVLYSGDMNVAHQDIDLARPKDNVGKHGFTNEEREGFDNYLQAGFVDTFRIFDQEGENYTWWTHWANARARNVGWRIDYWLASASLRDRITNAEIHPNQLGSDHCPTSLEIE